MIVCGAVSLYFSNKMIRLVLLLSPAAAVCAGAALGWVVDQTAEAMLTDPEASAAAAARERAARAPSPSALAAARAAAAASHQELLEEVEEDLMEEVHSAWRENVRMRRAGGCGLVLLLTCMLGLRFVPHAWRIGQQLSEPQLLFRGVDLTGSGQLVQVCWRHSLWLCLLWPYSLYGCACYGCACYDCACYGCTHYGCACYGRACCGRTHYGRACCGRTY